MESTTKLSDGHVFITYGLYLASGWLMTYMSVSKDIKTIKINELSSVTFSNRHVFEKKIISSSGDELIYYRTFKGTNTIISIGDVPNVLSQFEPLDWVSIACFFIAVMFCIIYAYSIKKLHKWSLVSSVLFTILNIIHVSLAKRDFHPLAMSCILSTLLITITLFATLRRSGQMSQYAKYAKYNRHAIRHAEQLFYRI